MMKNLLAAFLLLFSNFVFSQDYKKKIAKASCDCIAKVGDEIKDSKTKEMKLGLCMITASMPYSKELKRDYNIDVNNIGDESNKPFEELGGKIGLLMATECSDVFMKMFAENSDTSNTSDSELLLSGTLKKIEKDNFVVFHIVGENNNLTKFYWVSSIMSNLDLPKEYNSLLNKKVNISYYTTEIFDAKINDYRNLNIISSLKTD
ncbi:hypothetical protein CHRY9390_02509 [Chryseobacterium aquaeductus]|uniref:Uncharacterized protein n=1 Tax=Chryseobacterium aquaeductus TaxID=2675056 RepID=A0A9N8MPZ7_9FLAO|nr:hypothetical protein [Chryseobacterium aquaeductus]CAA7331793.1 hypothetical protein CHRY9390_02509 [Chryseobacterium potabilaquae]CAD7812412.1 hypothetical protein CHRY9390_02509 [Chryseobacterium aquaeductus]